MDWLMERIAPKSWSIKAQMLSSFSFLFVASIGVTLMICLSSTYALGSNTYASGSWAVMSLVTSNNLATSSGIASALNETLAIVAQSISLSSAMYSFSLVNENATMMQPQQSYREYKFVQSAAAGDVPSDFGLLSTRSRFPTTLNDFKYGSLLHSSVYLASNYNNGGVMEQKKDDTKWNILAAAWENNAINRVIGELEYQDTDMQVMFNRGPNTTVMFYVSASLTSSTQPSIYAAVHRTFPGINKATANPDGSAYDPPNREWFSAAPLSGVHLYGPYKETFTQQLVLTISARSPSVPQPSSNTKAQPLSNSNLQVVSAAVLLLDNVKSIVRGISYPKSGFGALLRNTAGFPVIVWKNGIETFDSTNNVFFKLSQLDQSLANSLGSAPLTARKSFNYTDDAGVAWIASAVPFFDSTTRSSSGAETTVPGLVIIVFAKFSDSTVSITALKNNIDKTTTAVVAETLVFIFSLALCEAIVVFLLISYSLGPLKQIIDVSREIINIATEEEENKDYSGVVNRAFFDMAREDEVGVLANDFFQMVCHLHNTTVNKRAKPKNPTNPFHDLVKDKDPEFASSLSFSAFAQFFRDRQQRSPAAQQQQQQQQHEDALAEAAPGNKNNGQQKQHLDDLDVLGSLMTTSKAAPVIPSLGKQYVPVAKAVPFSAPSVAYAASSVAAADQNHTAIDVEMVGLQGQGQLPMPLGSAANTTTYIRVDAMADSLVAVVPAQTKTRSWRSLSARILLLCALLWAALLVVMIVTAQSLQQEGSDWMSAATADITSTEIGQLGIIARLKAVFVTAHFNQLSLNTALFAASATQILERNFTRPSLPTATQTGISYGVSYEMDNNYPSSSSCITTEASASQWYQSGYFSFNDTPVANTCGTGTGVDLNNRVTSLLDYKFASLFFQGNILSNIQVGLPDGYLRQYPYKAQNFYSPTNCLVEHTTISPCDTKYQSCQAGSFPSYDARCRSWYGLSYSSGDPTSVGFTYPRVSSSGSYVVSSYAPLRKGSVSTGAPLGAVVFSVLAASLSSAINTEAIMSSGYVYLLDSKNITNLIVHPLAPKGATLLRQAEPDFSTAEWASFQSSLLSQMSSAASTGASVSGQFVKGGKVWYLTAQQVAAGTVRYTCVATVPSSDITSAADAIKAKLTRTLSGMVAAFVISMVLFAFVFVAFSRAVSRRTLEPFTDLQHVCESVKDNRLEELHLPNTSTSSDLTILLNAFGNLIIALKFGSDTFARDDPEQLKRVCAEALTLYSSTGNLRGIGAALNNLAYVEMAFGNFQRADELFSKSIDNAETLVKNYSQAGDERRTKRALRTLSDRRGNVAVLCLEQQAARNKALNSHAAQSTSSANPHPKGFKEAFEIIEQGLLSDKAQGYVKGIVVKQGTLGGFYHKQGELAEAEKIFKSCLQFVQSRDESLLATDGARWEESEVAAAEQIALANLATLCVSQLKAALTSASASVNIPGRVAHQKPNKPDGSNEVVLPPSAQSKAEGVLLNALCSTAFMDPPTCKRLLVALRDLLRSSNRAGEAETLLEVAQKEGFDLSGKGRGGRGGAKRVVFVLDYSGSMSGTKINSAVDNLLLLFDKHISVADQAALLFFTGSSPVNVAFHLSPKHPSMRQKIDSLRHPNGGTNLYDAIMRARIVLDNDHGAPAYADFIVALTDGQDGTSAMSVHELEANLKAPRRDGSAPPIVIVVGVGSDVNEAVLKPIAATTAKGVYIYADANKDAITAAFSAVASVISGQVVLEEV